MISSTIGCEEVVKMEVVELDFGGTYEGEWKDGMRNGIGTQIWANGNKYVGEWKLNKISGK